MAGKKDQRLTNNSATKCCFLMANDKIDNEIFVTILRIRKNNNRADLDSIYKEIKKSIDFEDVTKEFFDDRIHTLINDGKIIKN